MITSKQQEWLNHLSDTERVRMVPYDQTANSKAERVARLIKRILGKNTRVEHRGSTSLGIMGQDEIDLYVPVPANQFVSMIKPLTELFGSPRSLYPLDRARFVTTVATKHIDVFLINEESEGWVSGIKFEAYLKNHPDYLEEYRQLKETSDGISLRDYYRRKIEFINLILAK